MNLFFVVWDFIIKSWPDLHSGHSTNPSLGVFVPKITYFFFFAEYDRKPFESRYWDISVLNDLILFFVTLTESLFLVLIFET